SSYDLYHQAIVTHGLVDPYCDNDEYRRIQQPSVDVNGDGPGDAARPLVKPPLDLLVQRFHLDHVRDGETAARPEDAERLPDHGSLVLRQVDDAVGDHHVHRPVKQRHLLNG